MTEPLTVKETFELAVMYLNAHEVLDMDGAHCEGCRGEQLANRAREAFYERR